MFLKALYDFGVRHRLLEEFAVQTRPLHLLIPLTSEGNLRTPHMLPLTQPDERGKERAGQPHVMPRAPEAVNGGKTYFLASDSVAVLGRHKSTGEPIPTNPARTQHNQVATQKYRHFWEQIEQAFQMTEDRRLAAVLAFRKKYIHESEDKIECDSPFLEIRTKQKSGKPEFVGLTGQGTDQYQSLDGTTIAFSIDGKPLTLDDKNDPLRQYWFSEFSQRAFRAEEDESMEINGASPNSGTLCLITGNTGQPVARSHRPPIGGVPGLSSEGYLVSFANDSPAFSSYGFKMGENAPVSESAAATYSLALKYILNDNELHCNLGPLSICFWANECDEAAKTINFLLNQAYPEQVKEFLRQPFEGKFDREVLRRDKIQTIALRANKARLIVTSWLSQSLDEAIVHIRQWEEDINLVSIYSQRASKKANSPLAIRSLARVCLHQTSGKKKREDDEDKKIAPDFIVTLYKAALEGTSISTKTLKPILDSFQSALVKDSDSSPTYPFNLSRFALIKLILVRISRKDGGFMPEAELLANTFDPAYNCGRLLAILQALQIRSRNVGKPRNEKKKTSRPGAGVVERYYGRASTAPAMVLPLLLHLSRHHLAKLQQGDESDKKAAVAIERHKAEIMAKLRPDPTIPNAPPEFPRLLQLIEQGRFALGFYQQKAYDYQQAKLYLATHGQDGEDIDDEDEESTDSEVSLD